MKTENPYWVIIAAGLLGVAVSYSDWFVGAIGLGIRIPQSDSLVATEYWMGFPVVAFLGYVFPRHPAMCAISFMCVPVALRHLLHIYTHGIPNMWPLELLGIILLTIPYVFVAYAAAYARRNWEAKNVT